MRCLPGLSGAGLRPGVALLAAAVIVTAAMLVAGCGGDDESNTTDEDGTDVAGASSGPSALDYGSLSGEINIDGSSTVYPLTQAVAEEFDKVSPTRVNVAISGTGGGIDLFCRGEIDIADASRRMKVDENQVCGSAGIEDIVEIQIAIDALTVVVNPANTFVNCLSVKQLRDIFKAGGATRWNQVDPTFPDQPIAFYYPGTDSGTFDYFTDAIIIGTEGGATHRGDGTSSEDDNVLALGVEGDPNAIGYFGFSYYVGAGKNLKAVAVDQFGDGDCVEPSAETALGGTYEPLSRPLFIYTREKFLKERPEVLGFVNFYLQNVPTLVSQIGFVQMPDALLQEQFAKLEPFLH